MLMSQVFFWLRARVLNFSLICIAACNVIALLDVLASRVQLKFMSFDNVRDPAGYPVHLT